MYTRQVLDRTLTLLKLHVYTATWANIKTKTISPVVRNAAWESIKIKTISLAARMIAVLDRTLTLLKLHVYTVTWANIKTKTISPVVRNAVWESIKITTISMAARMIAVLARILTLLKLPDSTVTWAVSYTHLTLLHIIHVLILMFNGSLSYTKTR